jgi:LysR family transcriptional regulator, benzoate and cis,cis-muconate-responsive activator of ben and cat genes
MLTVEMFHLRYFVCVAEECHFARAAARLQMAPSPLSQRIKDLERDLGETLFERSYHNIRLTEAGQRLLPAARDLVEQFDQLHKVARSGVRRSRVLSVGFAPNVPSETRTTFLELIHANLNDVVERITLRPNSKIISAVTNGTLDVAFVHGKPRDTSLGWIFINSQGVGIAVPKGIGFDQCGAIAMSMLRGLPFVETKPDSESTVQRMNERLLNERGITRRIYVESDHQEDLAPVVSAGQGFTFVGLRSGATLKSFAGEPVIIRPAKDIELWLTTGMIYRADESNRAPIVSEILKLVRDQMIEVS